MTPPTPSRPPAILRLTLVPRGGQLPPVTHIVVGELFGSDIDGHAVPACNWPTFAVVEATVCTEHGYDFNGDGRADVRDLVLLSHCVLGPLVADSSGNVYRAPCADSAAVPGCNGDGTKDLSDVICCALRILRDSDCPGCPPDTAHSRPAPNVHVTPGAPVFDERGARLTLGIDGMSDVGGAVLRLRFPADRYDAQFERPESPTALVLTDVASGVATLGVVAARGCGTRTASRYAGRALWLEHHSAPARAASHTQARAVAGQRLGWLVLAGHGYDVDTTTSVAARTRLGGRGAEWDP